LLPRALIEDFNKVILYEADTKVTKYNQITIILISFDQICNLIGFIKLLFEQHLTNGEYIDIVLIVLLFKDHSICHCPNSFLKYATW